MSPLPPAWVPNEATSYDYDALDNLVHITQGPQHRYFKYDSLSRLIRERQIEQATNASYNLSDSLTGNSSWTRKFEYNSSGLITNSYDARGVQATFSYDDLNRVTQISYSDSTPTAHYYYDSQTLPSGAPSYTKSNTTGRLLAATYGSGATGTYFAYDTMGRVVTQKQVTGATTYSLSYAYNHGGLLTAETYPSGRALAFSYDEGGRLSGLSDGTTTFASSFSYAPQGRLTSETWGNTAVHTQTFNRRLQTSQVKLTVSSAVQQQYDYSYGEFNTGTGAVDTSKNNGQIGKINATIGMTAQWNQGLSYDALGRLANVVEYQGSSMSTQTYAQGYSYDRYGNRTQSANATLGLPAVSTSDYDTTNNNNRFVSNVATYDAAGNITSDAKFRSLTYTYDANGRQKTASTGAWTQTQVYDCAGQRVQTIVGSTTRTMVYDAFGQNVAEYSGAALERENIYRGDALLAVYETAASALRYVLTDMQGSARALLNSSGAVLARHDYLPFGEEIAPGIGLRTSGQGFGATDTNRQRYGLTERDDTSGLDHTWWRKYENRSGRWTSPDPLRGRISAPQSFNAYTYAANDPVNFVDPTGLDPQGALGGLLGQIPSMGPGTSNVMVPIGWGDPIARQGGSSGDGTEWVTLAVVDPNARLAAAKAELIKRLQANKGDNACARLFGGLENALKKLNESKITLRSMGGPISLDGRTIAPFPVIDARTKGKEVTINTDGRFMAEDGKLPVMGRPGAVATNVNYFGLDDVASAALILGHELGHRTGKLEDEKKAKDPEAANDRNNQKVYDACFAEGSN